MALHLRPATLEDVVFLADVVITATLAQGRFPHDIDLADYRAGYEEWTRETFLGAILGCMLSVIEADKERMGCQLIGQDEREYHLAYYPAQCV